MLLTLTTICQGGIYDHLGGGFARYATDARWLVPHFEKMLYDNAELVELLTLVWQETRDPLYAAAHRRDDRLARCARWRRREGGFDRQPRCRQRARGRQILCLDRGRDRRAARRPTRRCSSAIYDVDAEGNWEGHTILNRLRPSGAGRRRDRGGAGALPRNAAGSARARGCGPGLDDKVLADWNGLMIAALAEAGLAFERADWLALAARAFAFVREQMTAPDGRLCHSWRAGKARHPASLDDYANLCRAALALHEATRRGRAISRRRASGSRCSTAHYWDGAGGGYFFAADDTSGPDRPDQDRRRRRGPRRQRHDGRGVGAARLLTGEDAYRPPRRGDHRRLRRRGRAQFLPARDPDQQCRAGA